MANYWLYDLHKPSLKYPLGNCTCMCYALQALLSCICVTQQDYAEAVPSTVTDMSTVVKQHWPRWLVREILH